MSYHVRWRKEASDELTDIWLDGDATDRREVTNATAAIDKALARNPEDCGESRSADRRILFNHPLAVIFQVLRSSARFTCCRFGGSLRPAIA
ncbi:MAG: hypothetical protein B7Z73_04890 [Planctomycetia bacterium 21-64-5]|nr:MAG: hypothetical protein B7Z73_04890 [Planctomycetia bacterium 21-64-5]